MTSASDYDDNSEEQQGYAYYLVGLSLGILLVIIVITFISYYCIRPRSLQNGQIRATANTTSMELDSALTIQVGQQEAVVMNRYYPVLLYSQAKQHKADSDSTTVTCCCCSICLADYNDTDLLKLLPDCGHMFHCDCIDRWFHVNPSCPVCRNSPLPTPLSTPLAEVIPLATRHD